MWRHHNPIIQNKNKLKTNALQSLPGAAEHSTFNGIFVIKNSILNSTK